MARICIVLCGQLGNAPRAVKEAKALSSAGHDVTVVAQQQTNAVEQRDQDILRTATWRTIRVPFDQSLRWKMLRLRQTAFQHVYDFSKVSQFAMDGISAYTPDLTRAALKIEADLYIAHYAPALPAAARAAARYGALYAFDGEDFHPGDLPDTESDCRYNRVLDALDRQLLPGCAYVSAASPGIADLYAETYRITRPIEVLNVFPKANAPPAPTPAGTASPGPSLYWYSQIIGAKRGLEHVVRALPLMKSQPHFYVRGIAREDFVADLKKMGNELGVLDRLHILPPAMPDSLERLAADYDIGISPELGNSRNHRVSLGNKLFSYLTAGVPIVASDIPGHAALAKRLDGAMTLFRSEDPQSIATAVDAVLASPERLRSAREAAWRLGQDRFSWDIEQRILVDIVERVLGAKTRAALSPSGEQVLRAAGTEK